MQSNDIYSNDVAEMQSNDASNDINDIYQNDDV